MRNAILKNSRSQNVENFNEISDGYICDYVLQSATLLENGICIYYFVGNTLEFFRLAIL